MNKDRAFELNRRTLLKLGASASAGAVMAFPPQVSGQTLVPKAHFGFEDVVARAKAAAAAPFTDTAAVLPDAIAQLDFDAWRDIRFKQSKQFLGGSGGAYRLQLFHLGHLFKRRVVVNTIRDGISAPIPYSPSLFDFGRTTLKQPLPVDLGFAGFRLHTHLNDPKQYDELISFLGASYFRFLGRGQHYGLSCRALAINAGTSGEEFPFFREFWVDTPGPDAIRATIYAQLDSASATGAMQMDIYPGENTVVAVNFTLFARVSDVKFGLAPLTSMFLNGENDRRVTGDFRPELHDSDGLLIQSGHGEWLWRPLHNPAQMQASSFLDQDIKGFGLLQRDRNFDHYQDLDLAYQVRPSYFVQPHSAWGKGRIELIELPTGDESNDNIVASWVPDATPEVGKPFRFGYSITATLDNPHLSPGGRAVNTFVTSSHALGAEAALPAGAKRYIIDFTGGDLAFFANDVSAVQVMPVASNGTILRSSLDVNAPIQGFRATVDVAVAPGQSADLRVFLQSGARTLTETWTFPVASS